MSFKCKICGQKLKGRENFCPNCSEKIVYECRSCGKIMDNGKYKYCPLCKTEKNERKSNGLKKVGVASAILATVVTVVTTVISSAKADDMK